MSLARISRNLFKFAFEDDLKASRVYRRISFRTSHLSLPSIDAPSVSWSILSGLSMSDVSKTSVLALSLVYSELFSAKEYDPPPEKSAFNAVDTQNFRYVPPVVDGRSKNNRFSDRVLASEDIEEGSSIGDTVHSGKMVVVDSSSGTKNLDSFSETERVRMASRTRRSASLIPFEISRPILHTDERPELNILILGSAKAGK